MIVPLIIDGEDIVLSDPNTHYASNKVRSRCMAQGVTPELCRRTLESSAAAFPAWSRTSPVARQALFQKVAQLIRDRSEELLSLVTEELDCSSLWASINLQDTVGMADQAAALITSGVLSGTTVETGDIDALRLVLKEPMGVILGIAPWNAPAILGLRAVAAPVAAGNCVLFKGSELSPRTHYFIAKLFRDAGFPPGVVNFITHDPKDASATFETLISHPCVRKCNFTGSTAVGRVVAARAGYYLKPVLLELGGKNMALILDDADLAAAAEMVLVGALLNNGQICMSTDLVFVPEKLKDAFCDILKQIIEAASSFHVSSLINERGATRVSALLDDAKSKGAAVMSASPKEDKQSSAIILVDVTPEMDFWAQESFGPVLGVVTYKTEEQAMAMMNDCEYGLSGAIYTRADMRGVQIARRLSIGAVHVNGPTVHDEALMPHGGLKNSGFGRFGSHWAFEEFLQTKTVIVNSSSRVPS